MGRYRSVVAFTYDNLRQAVHDTVEEWKDARVPDDFAQRLRARLVDLWPDTAPVFPLDVIEQIDRGASGHSDYGHKMALRLGRAAAGLYPFEQQNPNSNPWQWEAS